MRYVGQGHEIPVPIPPGRLDAAAVDALRQTYDAEYARFYDRPVPGSDVEVMSYAVTVATIPDAIPLAAPTPAISGIPRSQHVRDTATGAVAPWAVHDRTTLAIGATIAGPAIIAEDETSTLIGPGWHATIDARGYLDLRRETTP